MKIILHMWTFLYLFVYIAFNSTNINDKESFFRYYEGVIGDNVVIFGGTWLNLSLIPLGFIGYDHAVTKIITS